MLAEFALFATNCLVFVFAFRGLSAADAGLPPRVRLALGAGVVLAMAAFSLWAVCSAAMLLLVFVAVAIGSIGFQGTALGDLGDAMGRYRFPLFILSTATLAALVFVFVPITTFLTSPGEIDLHLGFLLSTNVRHAMIVVYVAAAAYALAMSPRLRTVLALLAVGSLALGLLYSYVLPFGYPMMTGLTFEQMPVTALARMLRVLADAAVVVGVAFALRWSLLRFGARPFVVGVGLAIVSLSFAAGIVVRREQVGGAGGPETDAYQPAQPLRFSRTQPNVLIVFLDRFMGSYVESIVQSDPGVADRLSGFTWYPRTVAAGENSIAGVHPMLGGYDYTPVEMNARKRPLRDLSVEAFSILPYNFAKHGWDVNLVDPRGLGFTMAGDCSFLDIERVTCTHIAPSVARRRAEQMGFPLGDLSRSNYADLLVLLGTMRAAPYSLKEVLRARGPWKPFLDHSSGTTFQVWAELDAFPELTSADASEPTLNFVSSILAHEPYYMGEDCLPRRERFSLPDAEIIARGHRSLFSLQHAIAARCTLLEVADYLDHLKRLGVYDNTQIVIVSDHGIVGPVEDRSSRAVAGGTVANAFVRFRSVLLVKPIGAGGPLQVSEKFLPNAEVPRIVCEQIGGCVNPYLDNRPIAAFGRDDPFFVSMVPWQFSLQEPDQFVIHTQLALTGKDPFARSGWAIVK